MTLRIYTDTSVIGGCLDREFQVPSSRLVEKFKPDQEQLQKDMEAETKRISAHPEWVMEMMEGLQEIGAAGMKAQMMAK